MHSTNNEGKYVIAERFIKILKTKIYKYMTSISKSVYVNKIDNIVKKYNNTYHTSIKMKLLTLKIIHISILKKTSMIKILNLKLMIM